MEISEILVDSFKYPIKNLRVMGFYLVLFIVAAIGLVIIGRGIDSAAANIAISLLLCIIGFIILIIPLLLLQGYLLDVIKIGIIRGNNPPGLDIKRQILNALKLLALMLAYMGVPVLLTYSLGIIHPYLSVIGILMIIVSFFPFIMAQCKLAQTDSLTAALAIGEAIGDLIRIGTFKVVAVVIIFTVLSYAISIIGNLIQQSSQTIGILFTLIFTIYLGLAQSKGYGLLYSYI